MQIDDVKVVCKVNNFFKEGGVILLCDDLFCWSRLPNQQDFKKTNTSWYYDETKCKVMFDWDREDKLGRTRTREWEASAEFQHAYQQAILKTIIT